MTSRLPGEGTTIRLLKTVKELGMRGSYSGMGAGQFAIYGSIKKACTLDVGSWYDWRSRDCVSRKGGALDILSSSIEGGGLAIQESMEEGAIERPSPARLLLVLPSTAERSRLKLKPLLTRLASFASMQA